MGYGVYLTVSLVENILIGMFTIVICVNSVNW